MSAVAAMSAWSDLVVICGVRRWDGSGSTVRHVAEGLAEHGPVLYVDPLPVAGGTSGSEDNASLRIVDRRLAHLTPRALPGGPWPGSRPIADALARRSLRHALAELGSPSVRAVIVSSLDPWFGVGDEEVRVVYVADDFLAGAAVARLSEQRLLRELRRVLAGVDLVVAASPSLADLFRAEGFDPIVLPEGCDTEAFAADLPAPSDVDWLDGPVAGFVGDLSWGLDLDALEALARRDQRVVLVGRGPIGALDPSLRALLQHDHVHWIGPRPSRSLPAYVRHIDVGLAPFLDTPFGRARLPLDLLGHLAAGRPVVGTDCEALRWLRSSPGADDLVLDEDLAVASTAEEVADLVDAAVRRPPDPRAVERRQAFAHRHRWADRCAALAEVLELGHVGAPTTGPIEATP